MKKRWRSFIALTLSIFLFIRVDSLAYSQSQNAPNDCNPKISQDNKTISVYWENESLFPIANKKIGELEPNKRSKEICHKIQKFADDDYANLDNLKVKNLNGDTTIASSERVIVTLTDDDIRAVKVNIKDKNKIADDYLARIKDAVEKYRNQQQYFDFSWLQSLNKDLISILLIILVLIYFLRVIYYLMRSKCPKLYKLLRSSFQFTFNSFGRFVEFIIFLTIILLISKLILTIYIIGREAFFEKNIRTINPSQTFEQAIEVLKIIGMIFLFTLISLVIRWLAAKGKGTVVIAFEDLETGDRNKGKAIANSLISELNRIKHINTIEEPDDDEHIKLQLSNIPPLIPVQEKIESNLMSIGIFEIGNAKIPIGQVLLGLRVLWPFGDTNRVISGDIQKYETITRLVVRLEDRDEVKTWEITSENMPITDMIREMAYKVSLYIAPNITAQTWEGFKFFTEAIAHYNKYRQTLNEEYLKKAKQDCIEARKFENKYEKLADLLYEIGIYYLEIKRYREAEEAFNLSKEINPMNKYLHNAIGNLYFSQGHFLNAEDEYNIAIMLDQSFSYPYNGLGNIQYEYYKDFEKSLSLYQKSLNLYQSTKKKKNFSRPYHNMGNVYLYRPKNTPEEINQDYQEAEKQYIESKKHSNFKLFLPYCGLGLTYFFQAIAIQIPTPDQSNIKKLLDKRKELLDKASHETLLAISIKNNEHLQWNMGLIKLWQDRTDEALNAWKEALKIIQKQSTKDKLLIAILKYLINALSPNNYPYIQQNVNDISNLLQQEKYFSQKGHLEQILKDLIHIHESPKGKQLLKIEDLISIFKEATSKS